MKKKNEILDARRILAEASLVEFIQIVHPNRVLGNIHREVIDWWTSSSAKSHQLLLLPRDHMKSALVAYRVAWELTKDPTMKFLYISSTSNLARKQLKFIKDILTCDNYRQLWPEMVNKEEVKREKWTETEISVDHPKRKAENIRDPSIFTAGLTTNIVGMHSDVNVLDDVVVHTNAYIEQMREKVKEQYGYLSSIGSANHREWVVGTRYHPQDLYGTLLEKEIETYDLDGQVVAREPLFEVKEAAVENIGDGTGQFIWPLQQRSDGKWFGFSPEILARKRAQYDNRVHFRAQYYNDPRDVGSSVIQRTQFQYYDRNYLSQRHGVWTYKGHRLNLAASIDFAFTTGLKSDYTSIVVVGADGNHNYYILDIDRFKTDSISEYYKHIFKMYQQWGFRKLRAEVTGGQSMIVKDLKENYIRKNGISLSVDEHKPVRWQGSKEERILSILEPKYANGQIWHYIGGGYIQDLEEELIFANPAHDDIKDALASAIEYVIPPIDFFRMKKEESSVFQFHGRWGGVA